MSIPAYATNVSVVSDVLHEKRPAGLARATVAARTIVETITHILCAQRLATTITHNGRVEIAAASLVPKDQRRFAARQPVVAPAQHRDQRSIEILALFSQRRFVAFGMILIFATHEDSFSDQPVKTVCPDVRRHAELVLKVIEAAYAEECFTNAHETPAVADDFQRLRHRTWTAAIEDGWI